MFPFLGGRIQHPGHDIYCICLKICPIDWCGRIAQSNFLFFCAWQLSHSMKSSIFKLPRQQVNAAFCTIFILGRRRSATMVAGRLEMVALHGRVRDTASARIIFLSSLRHFTRACMQACIQADVPIMCKNCHQPFLLQELPRDIFYFFGPGNS